MRTILSVLLSFVLGLSMLFFTFFFCVQTNEKLFGKEIECRDENTTTTEVTTTTTTTTKSTKTTTTKKPEEKTTSSVITDKDDVKDDINPNDITFGKLKEIIMGQNYEERGLDPKLAEYIIKDYDTSVYYNEWRDTYIDYLQGKASDYKLDRERVEAIVQRSIEAYNHDHEDKKMDSEKVFDLTHELEDKADNVIEQITNDERVQKVSKFVFNEQYKKYAFIISVVCIVLIVLLNLLDSVVYLRGPFIFNAVMALIGYGILRGFNKYLSLIFGIRYVYMTSNLLTFIIIYTVIGISLNIIYIIMKNYIKMKNDPIIKEQERKRQEKKKKKEEEEEDEEEE